MPSTLSSVLSYLFPLRHAGLIGQFVRREFQTRYRESLLGVTWVFLTPLLMLGVYTFVFRFVFKQRWIGTTHDSDLTFAVRMYAGLAVFYFFAECVNRAPRLILDQPHLVKKVVFPLEILPWVNAFSSMVHLGVALVLLIAANVWDTGVVHLSALALPLVWLALLPLCVGLGWILAAVGTFVRDIGQILGLVVSLMMFLTPIFFPLEALPIELQPWMFLNPLALTITQTRQVLLDGMWPDWSALAIHFIACFLISVFGGAFFKHVRKGFADVV